MNTDIGDKKCSVVLHLIFWPFLSIFLTMITIMMILATIVRAWALFCLKILRDWLWGSSDGKNDRPCCLFYFGRCIYIILFPFLIVSIAASVYVGAAFAMFGCSPIFLPFYLTVGLIKYIYLLCTVKEIWQPG